MARLKFDLQPLIREGNYYKSRGEHETWVRSCWANWGRAGEPSPCDCGYYADGWLVTCDDTERERCRKTVRHRLEQHYRYRHMEGLKKKREFPWLGRTPKHCCYWCKKPIIHGRVAQRAMHDGRLDEPECRWLHDLHTRHEVQRAYLIDRDGMGCKGCGQVVGFWHHGRETDPDLSRAWGPQWVAYYPPAVWVAPFCPTNWAPRLEVDHVIALAVAFEAFPDADRRRWFFGPHNLQALCSACHKAKTAQDRALLRQAYALGPEWAKAEVLRRLADAGLLRVRQTEGGTT